MQRAAQPAGSPAAVSVECVSYRYPASPSGVTNLSLAIAPGELVVCIGPSGCGKTTLLRLIAGFLTPDSGRISFNGDDVVALPTRARECGIVFQSYALFPHMRVWENVAYPLRVRGVAVAERRERARTMLRTVGLTGFDERLPSQLSGGQQQRVALARALVFGPRALLLDEPLSALDAATRAATRDEIRRIQREQDIATLLITHDQDEALSLADRVVVLRDGHVVQEGRPQVVYDAPVDDFVAHFVGRANLFDGTVVDANHVDTALGRLVTRPHGRGPGTAVHLLLRPERVVVVPANAATTDATAAKAGARENSFAASVLRDRFFGATRQVEVAVGAGRLELATSSRDTVTHISVPRDAIQFLGAT